MDYLRKSGKWRVIVNTAEQINQVLNDYRECNNNFGQQFLNYEPSTLIVWEGLYKFQNFIESENRAKALIEQLDKTTREYLGIVFHRFMQKKKSHYKLESIMGWLISLILFQ